MDKKEVKCEVVKHIAILSSNEKTGWKKRLNLVRWNDRPEKYDITLTEEEADELRTALGNAKF